MSEVEVLPEIKEIVGAILFASKQPVALAALAAVFKQTADRYGGITRDFAAAGEPEVAAAVESLRADLQQAKTGLRVAEVAQGFRIENVPTCGPWLRTFLEKGRPNRLSQPALETLAVIAYRQPVMRSEIESVRGVAVDQILRNLLDMQLIRITGRSELPGRPWMFGTTQKFLEHFGINKLDDLPGTDELRRLEDARAGQAGQESLPLPPAAAAAGANGEPIGFRKDVDEDRPGEDDVAVELGVAETAPEGSEELPEAPEGIVLGEEDDEAEGAGEPGATAGGEEDFEAKIARLYGNLDEEKDEEDDEEDLEDDEDDDESEDGDDEADGEDDDEDGEDDGESGDGETDAKAPGAGPEDANGGGDRN